MLRQMAKSPSSLWLSSIPLWGRAFSVCDGRSAGGNVGIFIQQRGDGERSCLGISFLKLQGWPLVRVEAGSSGGTITMMVNDSKNGGTALDGWSECGARL